MNRLPTLGGRLFLGDGGLETTMMFEEGIDLPCFASFLLLSHETHRQALRRYYAGYIEIARNQGLGFTLDTPTWRANRDWGERLGYSASELAEINRSAVRFADEIRAAEETGSTPIALCGTIGPRGDAYHPANAMAAEEAERYHAEQIRTFGDAGVDMVCAYTLSYAAEAVGIVNAAHAIGIPVSISFTVETDGRLPSGERLAEAVEHVDEETGGAAAFFMINCAHPVHFALELRRGGPWLQRLGGIRVNASRKSHAELDRATTLDAGDPVELASAYGELQPHVPELGIVGGCCGTDQRHVAQICSAWLTGGAS